MFKHASTTVQGVAIRGLEWGSKRLKRRVCVSCIHSAAREWTVDIEFIEFMKAGSAANETCANCHSTNVQTFLAFNYVRADLKLEQKTIKLQNPIKLVSKKIGAQSWCEECLNEKIRNEQEYISEDRLSNSRKCIMCRDRCRIAAGRHYWIE